MVQKEQYEISIAPIQGYTDWIYRNTFDKYFKGITTYYTPFVRVEKDGGFRNRDLRDIDPANNTVSDLVPQILPGSREEFRLLAGMLKEKGYSRIDINMGCPFPMIIGKRKGSGMLPFPEIVKDVLETVGEFPEIQFSLKTRLGWENVSECLHLIPIFNSIRLRHITVHARTGKQQYKGMVNPDAFEQFYHECKHPLFYNGDITSPDDITQILERFPVLRGVSVGRGILSSPLLANDFLQKEILSPADKNNRLKSFYDELFTAYSDYLQGETQLLVKMKTLWEYFLPESDRKQLKKIKKANRISEYNEAVNSIFRLRNEEE